MINLMPQMNMGEALKVSHENTQVHHHLHFWETEQMPSRINMIFITILVITMIVGSVCMRGAGE